MLATPAHLRNACAPVTPQIPAVVVSANAMLADRDKAANAGFVDCITKPIDIPVLLATVDRLLQRRRRLIMTPARAVRGAGERRGSVH